MLQRDKAALVVIDVQGRLLPHIHEGEQTVAQIVRLIRGFQLLGAPILVTEQYRHGLGPTDARIVEVLGPADGPGDVQRAAGPADRAAAAGPEPRPAFEERTRPAFEPIEKMTFSCAAHSPFLEALRSSGRQQVLLCGIESHVCVLQTALDLKEAGFDVFVAADAVSSRSPRNIEIALRRMEQEGIRFTSVEMSVFEMLNQCGTPEFKAWSKLIR